MFSLWNQEGTVICMAIDQDQEWRSRARAPGRYISTGTIPGNFLPEGMLTVSTSLWALEPSRSREYFVPDVLAFHVVDSTEGDSSRGSWLGDLPPVIRPSLDWTTSVSDGEESSSIDMSSSH